MTFYLRDSVGGALSCWWKRVEASNSGRRLVWLVWLAGWLRGSLYSASKTRFRAYLIQKCSFFANKTSFWSALSVPKLVQITLLIYMAWKYCAKIAVGWELLVFIPIYRIWTEKQGYLISKFTLAGFNRLCRSLVKTLNLDYPLLHHILLVIVHIYIYRFPIALNLDFQLNI